GRRAAAGIPKDLTFQTKPQLAAEIVKDLFAEGRCPPWVTGDEVYGRDAKLRQAVEDQGTGYVLKIPCSFRVTLPTGQKIRADHAGRLGPFRPGRGPRGGGPRGGRGWPPPPPATTCSSAAASPTPPTMATSSATRPPAGPARSPPWCAWQAAAGRGRK